MTKTPRTQMPSTKITLKNGTNSHINGAILSDERSIIDIMSTVIQTMAAVAKVIIICFKSRIGFWSTQSFGAHVNLQTDQSNYRVKFKHYK